MLFKEKIVEKFKLVHVFFNIAAFSRYSSVWSYIVLFCPRWQTSLTFLCRKTKSQDCHVVHGDFLWKRFYTKHHWFQPEWVTFYIIRSLRCNFSIFSKLLTWVIMSFLTRFNNFFNAFCYNYIIICNTIEIASAFYLEQVNLLTLRGCF